MYRGFIFAFLVTLTLITFAHSQTAGSIEYSRGAVSSQADNGRATSATSEDPVDAVAVGTLQPDAVRLANHLLRENDGLASVETKVRGGLWVSGDVTDALVRLAWIAGPRHARLLRLGRDNQVTLNAAELAGSVRLNEYSRHDAAMLLSNYISTDEGLLLLLQVTESSHRYVLHLGGRVLTAAGEVIIKDMRNLDNNFDSRINPYRRNRVKLDNERPPEGFDSLVAINPAVRLLNLLTNRIVPPGNVTFHELAEAYGKVDCGLDYLPHGSCPGAHYIAVEREERLVLQRPLSGGVATTGMNRILSAEDEAPVRQLKRNYR